MGKIPVLCVVGPTATGKTGLAVRLATELGGEVIGMDSMQVYRRMDIGTAKPTQAERQAVPHYLIDVAEPGSAFTVAQYAELAAQAIWQVNSHGRLPVLVGGTGFYLRALTEGLSLGVVQSDPVLRASLRAQAQEPGGRARLHARLAEADPASAARLHENDVQRVTRALEVYLLTGEPLSRQRSPAEDSPYAFCMIGTTAERACLYRRIEARVDTMMERGLLGEVRALLAEGVSPQAQAMQGIGYKELVPVALGGASLAEAVAAVKQNTRHYAKRQWTWFRAEERVQWLDMDSQTAVSQALAMGETFWKDAETWKSTD